jgi:hypothetical protein
MAAVANTGGRPASALPSVRVRALAFAFIVIAGAAGVAIGGSVANISCHGGCDLEVGAGSIIGGAGAAGGTAVVVTLTLRAMGEWKQISEAELAGPDPDGGAGDPPDGPAGDPMDGPDQEVPAGDPMHGPAGDPADGPDQEGRRSRNPSA